MKRRGSDGEAAARPLVRCHGISSRPSSTPPLPVHRSMDDRLEHDLMDPGQADSLHRSAQSPPDRCRLALMPQKQSGLPSTPRSVPPPHKNVRRERQHTQRWRPQLVASSTTHEAIGDVVVLRPPAQRSCSCPTFYFAIAVAGVLFGELCPPLTALTQRAGGGPLPAHRRPACSSGIDR